jgi:NAD(P)-dependent dehydrogenase (short-subunit alcohol dehydrogenase family)
MSFAPFDLSGKIVLITGGGGGIGLGMAEAVAQAGAGVVVWDRDIDRLEQAKATLSAYGVPVGFADVDVSKESDVGRAMADAVDQFGRLDAVFANAGFAVHAPFLEMTAEQWHEVLSTCLDGVVWTLREATRHMVDRANRGDPGGSLVVTSSVAAIEASPTNEAYSASKAGVLGVVRSLAVEFARYGVRANAILPGWIHTPLTETRIGAMQKIIDRRVPMRRWGTPADFGGLAVYLTSDASAYHTGGSFVVDGGYTIY